MIRRLISDEFSDVIMSLAADAAAADFERVKPKVLLLAFNTLEKAERYYLGLHRFCRIIHDVPHRTLILCHKEHLRAVYELCRQEFFDDYVLFWPLSHDGPRLLMSLHLALRALKREPTMPSVAAFAAEARQASGLEEVLGTSLSAARLAVPPVRQWAHDLGEKAEPHREAVRRLGAMAEQVRPVVLVVEDDAFQMSIVAAMLEGQACEVVTAGTGSAALAQVRRHRPDLIFLDVGLPDLNGVELLRRWQGSATTATIPVVIMTGHSERQVVMESMDAGARGFIVKPFEKALLLRELNEILVRGPGNAAVTPPTPD
jgi:CheY-like chemotaxis protein